MKQITIYKDDYWPEVWEEDICDYLEVDPSCTEIVLEVSKATAFKKSEKLE